MLKEIDAILARGYSTMLSQPAPIVVKQGHQTRSIILYVFYTTCRPTCDSMYIHHPGCGFAMLDLWLTEFD